MSLMSFILNTLQPRVNDPNNPKVWIPAQLAGMTDSNGNKVLPISASDQNLGQIQGSAGAQVAGDFASTYASFKGASVTYDLDAEPDPAAPLPVFAFPHVEIHGLQNISIASTPPTNRTDGYGVQLLLTFGAYSGTVNDVAMQSLALVGQYDITQALLYGDSTKPVSDWTATTVQGTGNITITLTNCLMVANATAIITGSGSARANAVTVDSLTLVGVDATGNLGTADTGPQPTVTVSNLTIDADMGGAEQGLVAIIENALQQPEATTALVQEVNALLAASENLASVNQLLAQRAGGVLDAILGSVPAGGLPEDTRQNAANAIDLYLFDRMRIALNDPDSSWYLPLQLAASADPVIDPYTNSRIDVPDQTIMGLNYTGIVLTEVALQGTSNAAMPVDQTLLDLAPITTTLTLGTLPAGPQRTVQRGSQRVSMAVPPAPPISFTAQFSLSQNGINPLTLTGTLTATISGVTGGLTVTPSGTDVDSLVITLSDATASLSGATINVSVALDPPQDNQGLEQLIDALFSKPQVQAQILGVLNKALAAQGGNLSNQLSQIARNAIVSKLGG